MSTLPAVTPELAQALEDLRVELEEVHGGTGNPVGASRALQRVAARHPFRTQGARSAFRLQAEKLLHPYFQGMGTRDAAKAVVWLAVDAAWSGGGSRVRG